MSITAAARNAEGDRSVGRYQRHRPEETLLYRIVEQHYPAFTDHLAAQGKELPDYVQREFEEYLRCGRLEHGFLRVRCDTCHAEHLVAFSWPLLRLPAPAALVHPCTSSRRGFCPSCGARRMAESAALLVDEVFPEQPVRQWVLSFPYPLRFLFARRPVIMGQVLGIVYRCIATHLIKKAGFTKTQAQTGAVTHIQRFGSALNLNIHLTCMDALMPWAQGCAGAAMARLAALVPKPGVNLTRFHGVFAPNSQYRTWITPAKRGKGNPARVTDDPQMPAERRASMTPAYGMPGQALGAALETRVQHRHRNLS